jgi:hypothetical protein
VGLFKAKHAVKQNDWWKANTGGGEVYWSQKYNRLCTSSFTYHAEYLGRGGHLQEMLLVMKLLKSHLFHVVISMNHLSVLTARPVGLTAPYWSQLGSSVEKKVTPEDVRSYPMSARSVSRSGGPLKENIKNCGSDS